MARNNGTTFCNEKWDQYVASSPLQVSKVEEGECSSFKEFLNGYYSRIILFLEMAAFFTMTLAYEGVILNAGRLTGDVYLNNGLGGVMDICATIVSIVVTFKIGCRLYIVANLYLASAACFILMLTTILPGIVVPTVVESVLALCARFGLSAAFGVMFFQAVELFPTVIRNTGFGICAATAKVGGTLAPWVVLVQTYFPSLTQAIFFVVTLFAGTAVLQFPETKNVILKMTCTEAESFYQSHFTSRRIPFFGAANKKSYDITKKGRQPAQEVYSISLDTDASTPQTPKQTPKDGCHI